MKRKVKIFLLILGIFASLIFILAGSFWYMTKCRYTEVDTQTSPDERCQLTLQMKGEPEWPFGSTYGRIVVRYDDKIIKKIDFEIRDDGATLRKENWHVVWGVLGVQITLTGSEQDEQVLQVLYDGSEEFDGYSEEQITAEIEKRYGNIRVCGKEGDFYCYDAGKFSFLVQNDLVMSDNYKMEYYRYLTDSYFAGRNRAHEYEESGDGIDKTYTLMISLNSSQSEEKEWFCSDVVNWLLYVMKELPCEENEELYGVIKIEYGEEIFTYRFSDLQHFTEENVSDVYNDLYDFVEKNLVEDYKSKVSSKEDTEGAENIELTGEEIQHYLSLKPDCSYETSDGVEYRMIPVDRACGSSYYALVATADGGENVVMVNPDPYLGSGGGAKWITFFRSDGTYYNPFVVPEKVYEDNGKLYMEVVQ